jgi:hypothetical protein
MRAAAWIAALAVLASALPVCADSRDAQSEVVVLLHGLGRSAASMGPLADRLPTAGYSVRNLHSRPPSWRPPRRPGSSASSASCVPDAPPPLRDALLGGVLVRAYL